MYWFGRRSCFPAFEPRVQLKKQRRTVRKLMKSTCVLQVARMSSKFSDTPLQSYAENVFYRLALRTNWRRLTSKSNLEGQSWNVVNFDAFHNSCFCALDCTQSVQVDARTLAGQAPWEPVLSSNVVNHFIFLVRQAPLPMWFWPFNLELMSSGGSEARPLVSWVFKFDNNWGSARQPASQWAKHIIV